MIEFYSNKTKEKYNSLEAAEAAEKAFDEKVAAEQKKKEELAATRKARAAEVEEAAKAVIEAKKVYNEKLKAFTKDYGAFHFTVKTGTDNPFDMFDFFKDFWF